MKREQFLAEVRVCQVQMQKAMTAECFPYPSNIYVARDINALNPFSFSGNKNCMWSENKKKKKKKRKTEIKAHVCRQLCKA